MVHISLIMWLSKEVGCVGNPIGHLVFCTLCLFFFFFVFVFLSLFIYLVHEYNFNWDFFQFGICCMITAARIEFDHETHTMFLFVCCFFHLWFIYTPMPQTVMVCRLWNYQSAVQKADLITDLTSFPSFNFMALTENWITLENSATPAAVLCLYSTFSHAT